MVTPQFPPEIESNTSLSRCECEQTLKTALTNVFEIVRNQELTSGRHINVEDLVNTVMVHAADYADKVTEKPYKNTSITLIYDGQHDTQTGSRINDDSNDEKDNNVSLEETLQNILQHTQVAKENDNVFAIDIRDNNTSEQKSV